jgi:CRP/FNR family transcriptional regulator, cyclic AMP receptor protein
MFSSSGSIEKSFFKEGEGVFSEGDTGDAAFIIETGSVGIFKMVEGERVELAQMNEGELFGEMAVIDGSSRMANAYAREDSVIIRIPSIAIEKKLKKFDPFMQSLVQILVTNLRNVHQVYMKRPRSVDDYINAIAFHVEGFRQYIGSADSSNDVNAGMQQLEAIEAAVKTLRREFEGYNDLRASVLTEMDITLPGKIKEGDK